MNQFHVIIPYPYMDVENSMKGALDSWKSRNREKFKEGGMEGDFFLCYMVGMEAKKSDCI